MRIKLIICVCLILLVTLSLPVVADELRNVSPSGGATGECPCSISLCVYIANTNGSLMNLTFYSNLSGNWDYFYIGEENVSFTRLSNGTYCINVPFFSIYNHKYYWNASLTDGVSTIDSPVWYFFTAESPDDCGLGGGGSYSWITGLIIVFFCIPLGLIMRMRKRRWI